MHTPEAEDDARITSSQRPLKVGVYVPREIPVSFSTYFEAVSSPLLNLGFELLHFQSADDLPESADVLWDIRSGGGNAPPAFLLRPALPPLVVTVHGFAPVSLPGHEYFRSWRQRWQHWRGLKRKLRAWHTAGTRIACVIAVSNFTRDETIRYTGIDPSRIVVCHHGVDADRFAPDDLPREQRSYFLHVSNDEPRKNVERIIEAFQRAGLPADVELCLKVPADAAFRYRGIARVQVVAGHLPAEELAQLYQGAIGFIFPSLYEGFGMPILEAMAAGCPVVTSDSTACGEVAGSAALSVNPRQTLAIANAMQRLHSDAHLWRALAAAGRSRAARFAWDTSAEMHASALRRAAAGRRE